MRTLAEVMNTLEPERRAEIETRVQKTLASLELANLRKSQNLSQQALAKTLGVSQSAISQLETSNTDKIQLGTLANYIHSLGGTLQVNAILPNGKVLNLH